MSNISLPSWFLAQDPAVQAFLAGCFTWLLTAFGAASVFLRYSFPRAILDAMLGFAAGVMIAASFWSLLAPAIDMAETQNIPGWLPAVIGFLAGGVFLRLADRYLPHLHPTMRVQQAEGIKTAWQRTTLLILAITLHNIPEGLAVGVAFGAAYSPDLAANASLGGAIALAIGIGLQNFPEGIAVAMPLRREEVSRLRSFWFGQLSAIVEPIAALVGALTVLTMRALLPYALAFAAGAMIYVVVEELIPEAQRGGRTDLVTSATMIGFAVMMFLDVALG